MTEFLQALQRIWHKIDIFGLVLVAIAGLTDVFGVGFVPMVYLTLALITADTLVRWNVICKRYIVEHGRAESILHVKLWDAFKQLWRAETWCKDYLESRAFGRILEKIFVYIGALCVCFYAGQHMPSFKFAGLTLIPGEVFPGFISVVIFLVELSSLNENCVELGYRDIGEYLVKLKDLLLSKIKV